MSKKKKQPIMPPKGPPINLRPGGAHKGVQDLPRNTLKREAIEEQMEDVRNTW